MQRAIQTGVRFLCVVVCCLMLTGGMRSVAQDVSTDYDHGFKFNMFKGYAWGKVQATDPLLEPRLAAAIDHYMQQYGFKESSKTGAHAVDMPKSSVMILTAVEANSPQQYAAFYRGLSNLDWHRSWGAQGFSDSASSPRQIHGGTLVVDIYDGPTGKLVWRGTAATGNVSSEKQSQDDIDKEVATMFAHFPPKSGGPEAPNQVSVPPSPSSHGLNTPN